MSRVTDPNAILQASWPRVVKLRVRVSVHLFLNAIPNFPLHSLWSSLQGYVPPHGAWSSDCRVLSISGLDTGDPALRFHPAL